MRKLGVAEIIRKVTEEKTVADRVRVLQEYANPVLVQILKYGLDPAIVWDLPKGAPPYKKNEYTDQQSNLYREARRLYLFLKDGNPNLTPVKREMLFIQLLETIDPEDAEILIAAKDKKFPKSINIKMVNQAFPGLIPEGE
jgi:hypothetical protein